MREVKGLSDNSALAAVLDKHLTSLGIMVAEMRQDRDTHAPEDLEQVMLERVVPRARDQAARARVELSQTRGWEKLRTASFRSFLSLWEKARARE